jgi:hypothetical protein
MRKAFLSGCLVIHILSPAQEPGFTPLKNIESKQQQYARAIDDKYQKDLSGLQGKFKKELTEVYTMRRNMVKEKFESGEMLTDEKSLDYINAILQQVIKANQLPRSTDTRIAFSRTWWANAYSTGEGTFIFNAGLFHKMKNEAQVAFVICHELAHYYLDHGNNKIHKHINTFHSEEFQKKIKQIQKSQFKQNQQASELMKGVTFAFRRHSREDEAAADSMAVLLLKNTGYDINESLTCLALLDSVDRDKYNEPLNLPARFNFTSYPFKPYWLQPPGIRFSVNQEVEKKELLDSLKTHPDCSVRIEKLRSAIASEQKPGKKKFLISEDNFIELKKQFDYEIINYSFEVDNVSLSLYYTLKMLSAFPDDPYLNTMVGKCWNEIYKKQKLHELGRIVDLPGTELSEDYNKLVLMIQNLRLQEIAAISYYYMTERLPKFQNHQDFINQYNTSKQNFLK